MGGGNSDTTSDQFTPVVSGGGSSQRVCIRLVKTATRPPGYDQKSEIETRRATRHNYRIVREIEINLNLRYSRYSQGSGSSRSARE